MKAISFLRPGEALMQRLRFTHKLLVCLLLVAIPIAFLTNSYISELNRSIAVVDQERLGLRFVVPAVEHAKYVQQHRGTASRLLNGDSSARQALLEIQGKADGAVKQLDELVQAHATDLKTAAKWAGLKSTWGGIKSQLETMSPAESLKLHSDYITKVYGFVSEVANDSNLTFDPKLDSNYLMVMVTDTLPWVTEYMGQQRAVSSGVAAKKAATQDEKIKLYALKGNAEGNNNRLQLAMNQILSVNQGLKNRLEAKGKSAQAAVAKLQSDLDTQILSASAITVSSDEVFNTATTAIDGVYALFDEAAIVLDELLVKRAAEYRTSRATAIPLIAGGLALSAYLLLAFSTSARRSLSALEETSRRVAEGDLTMEDLEIESRDEIGRVGVAFNQTLQNLRSLIRSVSGSSQEVLSASEELAAASQGSARGAQAAAQAVLPVASGASEQARASDEVRETIEQLQRTIQQIASGSQQTAYEVQSSTQLLTQMASAIDSVADSAVGVAENASQAALTARSGATVVEKTVGGMDRIRTAVGKSAERIQDLEQLSSQIGEITEVISGIADQTNLLALNAAIEAARAGEHGRGFAVVAEEVRRLAERSSTSARDIAGLISNIQARTSEAVAAMETGTAEVAEGSQYAGEAGKALKEIQTVVEKAADEVRSISQAAQAVRGNAEQVVRAFNSVAAVTEENTAATEEMAAGATQVTSSVERVAAVSNDNAAAAQEVSAAVEELSASAAEVASSAQGLATIAQALQNEVTRFRL